MQNKNVFQLILNKQFKQFVNSQSDNCHHRRHHNKIHHIRFVLNE